MKCNTVGAIWMIELRCPGHFKGELSSYNLLNLKTLFHLLSTNDI